FLSTVQWMCWPRFDSSFIFGGLLDEKKGGTFSVSPFVENFNTKQYYIENTNVLCTEFESSDGKFRVTDFAPRFVQYERIYKPLMLIRKIEPLSGNPRVRVLCKPVGDYGENVPEEFQGSSHIRYHGLNSQVRLSTNIPLSFILENQEVSLHETKYLILTWGIPLESSIENTAEDLLRKTIKYWREWVKNTSIGSFYQSEVIRSALVLKIHQFEDTGAIVASGTTSLPEHPGSGRNWDYRYCWIRDSYYALTAFNNIGHFQELEKYFQFVLNVTRSQSERYQPLYSITGELQINEKEIGLEGYLGNKPVRVGNAAYTQPQNDVYGQILLSLLPLYVDKRLIDAERSESLKLVNDCLKIMQKNFEEPDAGLWEFRMGRRLHCYTYLFHWAGSAAVLKIANKVKKDSQMVETAKKLMLNASKMIEACYDKKRGVYTGAVGSNDLDASTLQLITMNYLNPKSEIAQKHLSVIEKELKTKEGLLYRYKHQDDFGTPKSTFLICAFWYVEALAAVGRIDDAVLEFQNLMKYSNHLGLFSEDVEENNGGQWGNFPQTYSHVGLVNAAFRISKSIDDVLA
ncbi:MAG: glycoside hydrolase family 15 protein, partial [Cytophagales bacterium]